MVRWGRGGLRRGLPEKARLLGWLSVLLASGFLAVSLGGFQVSKDAVRQGILAHELPLTGDNIYSEIQKDLLRPIFISSVMAQDTFFRDWVLRGEHEPSEVTRYLKEIMERYRTVTAFFVSERSRTYYHADGILKSVRDDEPRDVWYFRVKNMTQPFEINVDPDMANRDAMTIFINYRVFDYAGSFLGATGVGLTVDAVRQAIDHYEERFHRRIYFVDKTGAIVLHGRKAAFRQMNVREAPGIAALADAILATGAQPASFEYRDDGAPVVLNTRYIPELGWHLLVEQKLDKAFEPLRASLAENLLVSAAVTLVVLFGAAFTVNRYQSRLEQMATTDKLTGLLNRQAVDLLFRQIERERRRAPEPISVILVDVDHFKAINDTNGHLAGDRVIVDVAAAIREGVRDSDIVARWGGEEFLVLLRDCPSARACAVGEKIRALVAERDFGIGRVTVSLGVAELPSGSPLDDALGKADAALYEAKESGRNRLVVAGESGGRVPMPV